MARTVTIDDIFSHVVIDRIISQLRGPTHRMCYRYGLMPGMANVDSVPGRKFGWDIFNNTRQIAQGRAPGTAAANVALNPVGNAMATAYRMFESTPLDYERIFRTRGVGSPLGAVDPQGEKYITKQMLHKMRRFMNAREFMVASMFKGGFNLKIDGDDVVPIAFNDPAPAGQIAVNFRLPSTNTGNCSGALTGGWDTVGTSQVISDLIRLNDVAENSARFPLNVGWVSAQTAIYMLKSDEVKSFAGTANTVFNQLIYDRDVLSTEGAMSNAMSFVLKGFPQMTFYVYGDSHVNDDGTTLKIIPDGKILCTPTDSFEWLEWRSGSELVQKYENGPVEEQFGFGMWKEIVRNPLGLVMFALDNGLPVPYVPQAWYYGDVYTP